MGLFLLSPYIIVFTHFMYFYLHNYVFFYIVRKENQELVRVMTQFKSFKPKNSSKQHDDVSFGLNEVDTQKITDYPVKKASVIASGSVIHGDISVEDPLSIRGEIHGNVQCSDRIDSRNGHKVFGDINAQSAYFVGGELIGNIQCDDRVELDEGCTLKGNIIARSIVVAGKVDGHLTASDFIQLNESARVNGDLVAASFGVQKGALLEGRCTIKKQDE